MEIAIHIGQAKTGSTSIQHWMASNSPALRSMGWKYLETGRHEVSRSHSHIQIEATVFPRKYADLGLTVRLPDLAREMLAEADQFGGVGALISLESLFHGPMPRVARVIEAFQDGAEVVRLIVYVRRQAEQLDSLYRQRVKVSNWSNSFEDWLADSNRSAYVTRMEAFDELLRSSDSIVARTFSRAALGGSSLIADFVKSVMGHEVPSNAVPVGMPNPSLDSTSVALKVALNRHLERKAAAAVGKSLLRWSVRQDRPKGSLFTSQSYHSFQDPLRGQNEELVRRWGLDEALIDDPPPRFSDHPIGISAVQAREMIADLAVSDPDATRLIDEALPADHPFRPIRRFVIGGGETE